MLKFTHNSKEQKSYSPSNLDFQPLIISNENVKFVQGQVPPRLPPKSVVKTTEYYTKHNKYNRPKQRYVQEKLEKQLNRVKSTSNTKREEWVEGSRTGGVFDRNLIKNELAKQERQYRADLRKKVHSIGSVSPDKVARIHEYYTKEAEIYNKQDTINDKKTQEIQKLKKLLHKERIQKQKNDQIYEQKKRQLEHQRTQLIKLQQGIIRNGPKQQKIVKKQAKSFIERQFVSNDRAKCHQQVKSGYQQFPEPTQSELITNSRSILRQGQLSSLMKQRQNCINSKTLNYTPTLIPLISKASYKIISTHISTLVQLFIDDLLQEQIQLLQEIQISERLENQKYQSREVLNDYQRELELFVRETEEIEGRVGRYSAMQFGDIYKPKYPVEVYKPKFGYDTLYTNKVLQLNLGQDVLQEIHSRSDRFKRFVSSFDEYKKNNLQMFGKCTQELIDEAIKSMAQELDRGSGDFVDLVFRNQFK